MGQDKTYKFEQLPTDVQRKVIRMKRHELNGKVKDYLDGYITDRFLRLNGTRLFRNLTIEKHPHMPGGFIVNPGDIKRSDCCYDVEIIYLLQRLANYDQICLDYLPDMKRFCENTYRFSEYVPLTVFLISYVNMYSERAYEWYLRFTMEDDYVLDYILNKRDTFISSDLFRHYEFSEDGTIVKEPDYTKDGSVLYTFDELPYSSKHRVVVDNMDAIKELVLEYIDKEWVGNFRILIQSRIIPFRSCILLREPWTISVSMENETLPPYRIREMLDNLINDKHFSFYQKQFKMARSHYNDEPLPVYSYMFAAKISSDLYSWYYSMTHDSDYVLDYIIGKIPNDYLKTTGESGETAGRTDIFQGRVFLEDGTEYKEEE